MPGGLEAWLLNGTFRANLRMALSGGGQVGGADMVKLGHILLFIVFSLCSRGRCQLTWSLTLGPETSPS